MSEPTPPPESHVTLWGQSVSFRGILALISIVSLCVITFLHPELFGKAFESATLLIVGFYFGQNSKK